MNTVTRTAQFLGLLQRPRMSEMEEIENSCMKRPFAHDAYLALSRNLKE